MTIDTKHQGLKQYISFEEILMCIEFIHLYKVTTEIGVTKNINTLLTFPLSMILLETLIP